MNWKKIIEDLMQSGMTQSQIADRCGTGQSYISELLREKKKSPSWILGESLLSLYKKVLQKESADDKAA